MEGIRVSAAARTDVVVGVIVRGGRMLLTQRRPDKSYPWTWESPGGKVEPGETHEYALRRELLEELGANAEIGDNICSVDCEASDVTRPPRRVTFYVASIVGEPCPRAAVGLGWFTLEELAFLPQTRANTKARARLVPYMLGPITAYSKGRPGMDGT